MNERSDTERGTRKSGDEGRSETEASVPEEAGVSTAESGKEGGEDAESDTPGHIDEVAPPEVELDAEQELEELRDRHLRLAAEFDNFRRRTRRELLETGERGRADLAARLLEVIDDLQRVAETPPDSTTTEALHEGVDLVARKLRKTLSDAGMERLHPIGERFDPNLHEALFVAATDDPELDESVSEVVLAGYRIGERLLRPAQVGVYRYEEESA